MENLRNTLEILFLHEDPEKILNSYYKTGTLKDDLEIDSKTYADYLEVLNYNLNRDECEAIHSMATDSWYYDDDENKRNNYDKNKTVFNVIKHFANKVLKEDGNVPVCDFNELLRWREISYKLGEDIFTTAFFASADLIAKRDRHFFAWTPIIKTNDVPFNSIMKRGLSELHFHFYGSSLNFEIGWLSLMNDIEDREKDFKQIEKSKFPKYNLYFEEKNSSLYLLYVKAFAIRLYLFMRIIKDLSAKDKGELPKEIRNVFHNVILAVSYEEVKIYLPELIKYSTTYKMICGKKYKLGVVDYAIRQNLSEQNYDNKYYNNVILTGERWLMYKVFKKIFSNDKDFASVFTLFYVYLIVKSKIRSEIVQINKLHGFANFQEYQGRKGYFIKSNSIYEKLIVSTIIANSFNNQNVKYLEARIKPDCDIQKNINNIINLDYVINNNDFCEYDYDDCELNRNDLDKKYNYYFIWHFIKTGGLGNSKNNILQCRNFNLRKDVEIQTKAINTIRKSFTNTSNRLVGLDAASSEIGHRPEVFAQAYRYLKKYSYPIPLYEKVIRKPFGYTYHVGEDFLDLADGLRAIDEVIKFLRFGRGDRLGHALALAVDPKLYYEKRNKLVIMPKIDLLDNIVWILMQNRKYNLQLSGKILLDLENLYWKLFCLIYTDSEYKIELIPFEIYYQSWLLRGDDPQRYIKKDIYEFNCVTFWEHLGLNDLEEVANARKNEKARILYYMYHFDNKVRENGQKYIEFKIEDEYILMIKKLQMAMQKEVAKLNIVIETNPTSNKLIGPIDNYIEHPIFNMYNLHLEQDRDKIMSCPQLSVSINTDDLGVFGTSIENEYALLAVALGKENDENGNSKYQNRYIYNWLESIRQMGEEQRFVKE